jgi:hypothetical protein
MKVWLAALSEEVASSVPPSGMIRHRADPRNYGQIDPVPQTAARG